MTTLFHFLAQTAGRTPEAPAIGFHDRVITYGELHAQAGAFAGGLAALPVKSHARIALLLPNSPAFVIAYLGASRAGATIVPMNVLYRPDEARYILADAGVEAIVTIEPFRSLVQALRPLLPSLKHVIMADDGAVLPGEIRFADLCAHAPAPPTMISERDIAVILYTSGTTGRPKGAMLSHRNLRGERRILRAGAARQRQ